MAKKESTELATTGTIPREMMAVPAVAGSDGPGNIWRRLHLYQGTTTEQEKFAGMGFTAGEWVDTLNGCKVKTDRVVPLCGRKLYAWWPKGEQQPEFEADSYKDERFTAKLGRPATREDTEYDQDTQTPPPITPIFDYMVLVGDDPLPFTASFKRTGESAGRQIEAVLESHRKIGQVPIFRFGSQKKQNSKGQSYSKPIVGKVGLVTDPKEIDAVVSAWRSYRGSLGAAIKATEGAAPEVNPDDIPF